MKRLLSVLMVCMMVVGCSSGSGETTRKKDGLYTKDGYEVSEGLMMAIAEKAIIQHDRQDGPNVKTDIKVAKADPVKIKGKENSDVYTATGSYTWDKKVFNYEITVAFEGKEGRYLIVRYRNLDTGTDKSI